MDNNIIEKTDYLVLLRGINVGGKNIVKMDLLKKLFEEMGFMDVKTYIQSGHILVKSSEKDKTKLVNKIEEVLFDKLSCKINIVILTLSEMENIVNNIPNKFGEENEKYKYDVIFLIEPLSKNEFKKELKTNIAGDEIIGSVLNSLKSIVFAEKSHETLSRNCMSVLRQRGFGQTRAQQFGRAAAAQQQV